MSTTGPFRYQRLLVSIFDWEEAIEALHGGAGIIDMEFPATALGDVKPTDILNIRRCVLNRQMSCNIGEEQIFWKNENGRIVKKTPDEMAGKSAQAALGVIACGVDIMKVGMDNMNGDVMKTVLKEIVQSMHRAFPLAQVCPVLFANEDKKYDNEVDPFTEGVDIASECGADGIMIDTRGTTKAKKMGLAPSMDPDRKHIYSMEEIQKFIDYCHEKKLECMLAGSIQIPQAKPLWAMGCDVIAVRGSVGGRDWPHKKVQRGLVSQMVPSLT